MLKQPFDCDVIGMRSVGMRRAFYKLKEHVREQEKEKINLKIINSGTRSESEIESENSLPYIVSIVCVMT